MSDYKKRKGYEGERLVADYYLANAYNILDQNYTIKGGEIDIVAENEKEVVFIEVKVVDSLDDIVGCVNPKKISFLERSIEDYVSKQNIDKDIRLDVVFVKDNTIIQVYENVTNS
ncbi:YraN family protein [Candidatus Gracilibacteria bacterium]|nr:YraN family protein [Candidatus Gracilibacteria bacterium]